MEPGSGAGDDLEHVKSVQRESGESVPKSNKGHKSKNNSSHHASSRSEHEDRSSGKTGDSHREGKIGGGSKPARNNTITPDVPVKKDKGHSSKKSPGDDEAAPVKKDKQEVSRG